MKHIYPFFIVLLSATAGLAQAPQSFNYQAVARDASGNVLANKSIGLQLSILDGSATGTAVYSETFTVTTNTQGQFSLAVGTGASAEGTFTGIKWATGSKYLKTELDPTGGSHYTLSGTSELLSVPYALYAASTGSASPGGSGTTNAQWTTNGNSIFNANSGGVGIETGGSPVVNWLQIGNVQAFDGNLLAMGNGSAVTSFAIEQGTTTWYTNNNFALMPAFSGTGNVGIGTLSPTNKLQIGSTPQFGGQDIAIGNGTQATSFLLSPTAVTWYSNVPFALMPANSSSSGTVGIGMIPSVTSQYKLTIQPNINGSGIIVQNGARTAFDAVTGDLYLDNGNLSVIGTSTLSGNTEVDGVLTLAPPGSTDPLTGAKASLTQSGYAGQSPLAINASGGDVWGEAFFATSDVRVKSIIGRSNPVADLDKLNRIRVTDYTMKDTLTNGHQHFKKVIAQQVEKVYPEVIRKQKGFIPNVYQETTDMERVDSGYLLSFRSPHHLSARAARIRVDAGGTVRSCTILSIPSDHEVLIKSPVIKATHAFVYGQEVDDFRSVDYEGLATLNISATQELSKLVERQEQTIERLEKRLNTIETFMRSSKHQPLP
jgi:hypothetical protein